MPLSWSTSHPFAMVKASFVLRGRALQFEEKRPVDLFDMDAAVLHWLEGVGQLHQLAGGGLGIGDGTEIDEFHGCLKSSMLTACPAPMAVSLSAYSSLASERPD